MDKYLIKNGHLTDPANGINEVMDILRAGESITGFVFGIGHIVVTPPFAAACAPVITVSLYSNPGSLKCTCKSTKPGITSYK